MKGMFSICTPCVKSEHMCSGPCACSNPFCAGRRQRKAVEIATVSGHLLGCECAGCEERW